MKTLKNIAYVVECCFPLSSFYSIATEYMENFLFMSPQQRAEHTFVCSSNLKLRDYKGLSFKSASFLKILVLYV